MLNKFISLQFLFILLAIINCDAQVDFSEKNLCKFSTNNLPKAKGLKINLKIPCGWKGRDDDRPSLIKKFYFSPIEGEAVEVGSTLSIIKAPTNPSDDVIREMLSYESLKREANTIGTYVSSREVFLDGYRAGETIFDMNMNAAIGMVQSRFVHYLIFYKNYIIILNYCVVDKDFDYMKKVFDSYLQSFRILASQMVIMSKYD